MVVNSMREPHESILDAAERKAAGVQWTARNLSFVRLRHRQGLSPGTIFLRCIERMSWDGPFPSEADIRKVIEERMT